VIATLLKQQLKVSARGSMLCPRVGQGAGAVAPTLGLAVVSCSGEVLLTGT
jgi:hypothetical protein